MADIPGIIEGAAEGKGLGLRFLRHIERNAVLLFLVPACTYDLEGGIGTPEAILREYEILLNELRKYNPQLLSKARVLSISKSDTVPEETLTALCTYFREHPIYNHEAPEATDEWGGTGPAIVPVRIFSSATHQGIDELKDAIWTELTKECNQVLEISHLPIDIQVIEKDEQPEEEQPQTIYMNEVDEEWDLTKYKGIGWDDTTSEE